MSRRRFLAVGPFAAALAFPAALLLCASGASSACGGASAKSAPPSAPSPLLDQRLKTIGGRTIRGERVDLQALQGRIVVVKFFAKYCKPCEKTLPGAQRLHQENPDIAVIGISEDESRADLDYLIRRYGLSFPIVLDRGNIIAGRFGSPRSPRPSSPTGRARWCGSGASIRPRTIWPPSSPLWVERGRQTARLTPKIDQDSAASSGGVPLVTGAWSGSLLRS